MISFLSAPRAKSSRCHDIDTQTHARKSIAKATVLEKSWARYLMRSVLLVDVQNVDPQPVSLLEGPVAQVAGELPVALIHAACVLEMLVPVVLVGKHLPAAVALEALTGVCRKREQCLRNDFHTSCLISWSGIWLSGSDLQLETPFCCPPWSPSG